MTSLASDQRGMVFIEAVLLFPLVALCIAGLLQLFGAYRATFEAGAAARFQALHASAGSCAPAIRGGPHHQADQDGRAQVHCPAASSAHTGNWAETPAQLDVLGRMTGTVSGATTEAAVRHTHAVPELLGGGVSSVRYGYAVACNERRPRLKEHEVVDDIACVYLGALGYGPCSRRISAPACGGTR